MVPLTPMTRHYPSPEELDEARACHRSLSPAAAQFLDYVLESPERVERLEYLADGLPPWTRTYPTTHLTWPAFVGAEKLRQIGRAVEKVCALVKILPERIFRGDARPMSDFYGYGDASLVELLREEPNGVEGAVARRDFVDGPAGFKCCEVNMAPNVGAGRVASWERKYLTHPTISAFAGERGIRPSHHDALRTLCRHIIEDTGAGGVPPEGALNAAVMCTPATAPGEEAARGAEHLRRPAAGRGRRAHGEVAFCSRADELSVQSGRMYDGELRIHAVVNYSGAVLPKQV